MIRKNGWAYRFAYGQRFDEKPERIRHCQLIAAVLHRIFEPLFWFVFSVALLVVVVAVIIDVLLWWHSHPVIGTTAAVAIALLFVAAWIGDTEKGKRVGKKIADIICPEQDVI